MLNPDFLKSLSPDLLVAYFNNAKPDDLKEGYCSKNSISLDIDYDQQGLINVFLLQGQCQMKNPSFMTAISSNGQMLFCVCVLSTWIPGSETLNTKC